MEQRLCRKYTAAVGISAYHTLMMIDVDYFKMVNDTYGHQCGDCVLSNVAAALKGNVRGGYLLGRIGRDEFLVYLPEVTEEASVFRQAEQILQDIAYVDELGDYLKNFDADGMFYFAALPKGFYNVVPDWWRSKTAKRLESIISPFIVSIRAWAILPSSAD